MRDRSESRDERGGPGDRREDDQVDCGHRDGPRPNGDGPDTRFLQLEISQVMYAEAEAVFRPAFRELLLEAAKERLREQFGDKITQIARLAVDEELRGTRVSLDIEARIREHRQESRDASEQLRDVLATRRASAEPAVQRPAKRRGSTPRGRKAKR